MYCTNIIQGMCPGVTTLELDKIAAQTAAVFEAYYIYVSIIIV